jgi:PIN domain nuclease of toxin-antitoxin system
MYSLILARIGEIDGKLEDAIIISTAIMKDCTLITADQELQKIDEIELLSF